MGHMSARFRARARQPVQPRVGQRAALSHPLCALIVASATTPEEAEQMQVERGTRKDRGLRKPAQSALPAFTLLNVVTPAWLFLFLFLPRPQGNRAHAESLALAMHYLRNRNS